jgi:hypothetical protein
MVIWLFVAKQIAFFHSDRSDSVVEESQWKINGYDSIVRIDK